MNPIYRKYGTTSSIRRKEYKKKKKETLKREKINNIKRERRALIGLGQWGYVVSLDLQVAGRVIDIHKHYLKQLPSQNKEEKTTDIIIDVAWSSNPTETHKHTIINGIENCIRFEVFDTFKRFMEQNFVRFL